MTEKRFRLNLEDLSDNNKVLDNEEFYCYEDNSDALIDKLNELSDENEQLKQREETLLNEIKDFQDILSSKEELCLKYVRNIIQDTITNERTEIGKNTLKQLLEKLQ